MYSVSMPEDGYPVCELELKGIGGGPDADAIDLKVSLDDELVRSIEIPVSPGDSKRCVVTIPETIAENLLGKMVKCSLTTDDRCHRRLVCTSWNVRIG
jgi:hypothetical protein